MKGKLTIYHENAHQPQNILNIRSLECKDYAREWKGNNKSSRDNWWRQLGGWTMTRWYSLASDLKEPKFVERFQPDKAISPAQRVKLDK